MSKLGKYQKREEKREAAQREANGSCWLTILAIAVAVGFVIAVASSIGPVSP